MISQEFTDGESYFGAFLEALASELDDKHIARKMGCSRGEVKRQRMAFLKKGALKTDGKADKRKLDAWLKSDEGRRAIRRWEEHQQKQKQTGVNARTQSKGFERPEIRRTWLRQKRGQ